MPPFPQLLFALTQNILGLSLLLTIIMEIGAERGESDG